MYSFGNKEEKKKKEHKISSTVKEIMLISFCKNMCFFTQIREIILLLLKTLAGQKLPL